MKPSIETKNHILQTLSTDEQRNCYRYLYDHGPKRIDFLADSLFPKHILKKSLERRMKTASCHLNILEKSGLVERESVYIGVDSGNRKRYLTEWKVLFITKESFETNTCPVPKKNKTCTNQLIADLIHHIEELVFNTNRFETIYPKTPFFKNWVSESKTLGNRCREYERSRFKKLMEKNAE